MKFRLNKAVDYIKIIKISKNYFFSLRQISHDTSTAWAQTVVTKQSVPKQVFMYVLSNRVLSRQARCFPTAIAVSIFSQFCGNKIRYEIQSLLIPFYWRYWVEHTSWLQQKLGLLSLVLMKEAVCSYQKKNKNRDLPINCFVIHRCYEE